MIFTPRVYIACWGQIQNPLDLPYGGTPEVSDCSLDMVPLMLGNVGSFCSWDPF